LSTKHPPGGAGVIDRDRDYLPEAEKETVSRRSRVQMHEMDGHHARASSSIFKLKTDLLSVAQLNGYGASAIFITITIWVISESTKTILLALLMLGKSA
jgi:hypothetical protein